eukprot:2945463-Rhodomonas_salina.2
MQHKLNHSARRRARPEHERDRIVPGGQCVRYVHDWLIVVVAPVQKADRGRDVGESICCIGPRSGAGSQRTRFFWLLRGPKHTREHNSVLINSASSGYTSPEIVAPGDHAPTSVRKMYWLPHQRQTRWQKNAAEVLNHRVSGGKQHGPIAQIHTGKQLYHVAASAVVS